MKAKVKIRLAALLAGFVNGLLGTGGGVPLCLMLPRAKEEKTVYATASLGVLLLSLQTMFLYRGSAVALTEISPFLPFLSVIGGSVGAVLFGRIKGDLLRLFFAGLLVFSGAYLIGKELYLALF